MTEIDEHPDAQEIRYLFVDEAGDLTLFNKRKAVLLGREGVSDFFMVGVAILPDPSEANRKIVELRNGLLADPYFAGVPSMSPDAGKTARFFHAKDDLPEIRMQVFKLVQELSPQVQVAIRRKQVLVERARALHARGHRLQAGDVYDDLVRRLFKNLLHQSDRNEIYFSRRGKSDRATALESAIATAKQNFNRKWQTDHDKPTEIRSAHPWQHAGLQVVDYCLWALQRLYERGEARYFNFVRDQFRLIMDLDDTSKRPYGEWYSSSNPIDVQKIKKPPKG